MLTGFQHLYFSLNVYFMIRASIHSTSNGYAMSYWQMSLICANSTSLHEMLDHVTPLYHSYAGKAGIGHCLITQFRCSILYFFFMATKATLLLLVLAVKYCRLYDLKWSGDKNTAKLPDFIGMLTYSLARSCSKIMDIYMLLSSVII